MDKKLLGKIYQEILKSTAKLLMVNLFDKKTVLVNHNFHLLLKNKIKIIQRKRIQYKKILRIRIKKTKTR